MAGLREELGALEVDALRRRAAEEGAGEDAVSEAVDSVDDPKQALIDLIVETRERGPAVTPRSANRPSVDAEDQAAMVARIREEAMAEARQQTSGLMMCTWKIIWNVVMVAVSGLTVLFGFLCKTDGFTSFGCDSQKTGTAVILIGVHMWVPAGWVLMGEFRPDTRKMLVSRDNKLLTIGAFMMFYALCMSFFGILCRADAMPTHDDCRATGFWLIFLALFLMNPATLVVLGWVVKWNHKRVWLREGSNRDSAVRCRPSLSSSRLLCLTCSLFVLCPDRNTGIALARLRSGRPAVWRAGHFSWSRA